MSLFQKSNDAQTVILFDVGSASIGAAIAVIAPDNTPTIHYRTRRQVPFSEQHDPKQLLSAMKRTLVDVAKRVHDNGLKHLRFTKAGDGSVDSVHVFFASPWYISQTQTVSKTFSTNKKISDDDLKTLVERAQDGFEQSSLSEYIEDMEDDLTVLEHSVIRSKLNGYHTAKPIGKRARKLEISVFLSVLPVDIKTAVRESVTQYIQPKQFEIHSFSLASFFATHTLFKEHASYLLMDVTGDLTDVSLIEDRCIVETLSFPIGKHALIRSVCQVLNTTPEEAFSRLARLASDKIEEKERTKTTKVINSVSAKWTKKLKTLLGKIFAHYSIPHQLYLLAHPDIAPIFKKIIEDADFSDIIISHTTFDTTVINHRACGDSVVYRRGVKNDPFLTLEAIFVDHMRYHHIQLPAE